MKKVLLSISFFSILVFFVSCITTFVTYSNSSFTTSSTKYSFSDCNFTWPLPGYYEISSNFGLRISPTNGASKYHTGIDIPAPERY